MVSECRYSQCIKAAKVGGYCHGHYRQLRVGQELRPLQRQRRPGAVVARDLLGRKECPDCGNWKDEAEFHRNKRRPDGLCHNCKACHLVQQRRLKYGTNPGERCDICGGTKRLSVDHDHSCCSGVRTCGECVRGTLCTPCNMALGGFRDSIDLLRRAVEYLEPR